MKKNTATNHNRWFTVGVAISLSAASFAKTMSGTMDEPWRDDEAPSHLASMTAADHVLESEDGSDHWITNSAWSGHWWPTREGSIAYRWHDEAVDREKSGGGAQANSNTPARPLSNEVLRYKLYTAAELAEFSDAELNALSAVEKLDIVAGNATNPGDPKFYRNTKAVRKFVSDTVRDYPKELSFHGLCAGFSNASLLLPEPSQYNARFKYTLSNGTVDRLIRFYSGDFKALATYFYADAIWKSGNSRNIDKWIGCGDSASGNCDGLNAGSFHLVLTTLIKKRGEGFVIDVDRGTEVWNFPVIGYRSTISNRGPIRSKGVSPAAVQEVDVVTTVTYLDEADPSFRPYGVNNSMAQFERTYEYRLELTAANRVVGGTWIKNPNWYQTDANGRRIDYNYNGRRPDFAWRVNQKLPFTGDYSVLTKYWKAAPQN